MEKWKQQIVLSSSMTIPFALTVLNILFFLDQTYRISRDLLDWIKYTLLHRQRRVSLFIWIQCGGGGRARKQTRVYLWMCENETNKWQSFLKTRKYFKWLS